MEQKVREKKSSYTAPVAIRITKFSSCPGRLWTWFYLEKGKGWHTVKELRGKVSFDSQHDKYASQLSCDASPEAYIFVTQGYYEAHLSFGKRDVTNTVLKYASGEASQDNCEAYLSFCESNDTLPRALFTVHAKAFKCIRTDKGVFWRPSLVCTQSLGEASVEEAKIKHFCHSLTNP
jgi:hypothetical protein